MDKKLVFRMLSEIGFLGTKYGSFKESDQLHAVVEKAYPGADSPAIGRAFNLLIKRKTTDAVFELRKQVELREKKNDGAPSDLLLAFWGLALVENGQKSEAAAILRPVLESSELSARNMARVMMQEMGLWKGTG